MLKSLVWKEFREVLPICATAIAAQLILFGYAVNVWRLHMPRDAYGSWPLLYITAVLMGVAVGIWQNVRDDNHGLFQFLLHRPIRRSTIFTVRLLVGAAMCLIVGLAPLVGFTIWIQGIAPNRETVTWEALCGLCAGIWLLYGGAFLSVLRPGRWYGSRFVPLFAAILLFLVIQAIVNSQPAFPQTPETNEPILRLLDSLMYVSALILGPLGALGFAIASLYVAEKRDYA